MACMRIHEACIDTKNKVQTESSVVIKATPEKSAGGRCAFFSCSLLVFDQSWMGGIAVPEM